MAIGRNGINGVGRRSIRLISKKSGPILPPAPMPWRQPEFHSWTAINTVSSAACMAGSAKHLDRFSAFRLPGRPTGYEWEAVSLPMIHGVAFNELFPSRYAVANLQYRYEALFFFFPYIEATWGLVERP